MATVAFTMPMMMSAAKQRGSFIGLLLNIVVFIVLVGFIWWFYKTMKRYGQIQDQMVAPAPSSVKPYPTGGLPGCDPVASASFTDVNSYCASYGSDACCGPSGAAASPAVASSPVS